MLAWAKVEAVGTRELNSEVFGQRLRILFREKNSAFLLGPKCRIRPGALGSRRGAELGPQGVGQPGICASPNEPGLCSGQCPQHTSLMSHISKAFSGRGQGAVPLPRTSFFLQTCLLPTVTCLSLVLQPEHS